jgi:hypothetical protein
MGEEKPWGMAQSSQIHIHGLWFIDLERKGGHSAERS